MVICCVPPETEHKVTSFGAQLARVHEDPHGEPGDHQGRRDAEEGNPEANARSSASVQVTTLAGCTAAPRGLPAVAPRQSDPWQADPNHRSSSAGSGGYPRPRKQGLCARARAREVHGAQRNSRHVRVQSVGVGPRTPGSRSSALGCGPLLRRRVVGQVDQDRVDRPSSGAEQP